MCVLLWDTHWEPRSKTQALKTAALGPEVRSGWAIHEVSNQVDIRSLITKNIVLNPKNQRCANHILNQCWCDRMSYSVSMSQPCEINGWDTATFWKVKIMDICLQNPKRRLIQLKKEKPEYSPASMNMGYSQPPFMLVVLW